MRVGRKVGLRQMWGGIIVISARRDGIKLLFGSKRIREQGKVHNRNPWMKDRMGECL
jgi:hypothetical protein